MVCVVLQEEDYYMYKSKEPIREIKEGDRGRRGRGWVRRSEDNNICNTEVGEGEGEIENGYNEKYNNKGVNNRNGNGKKN